MKFWPQKSRFSSSLYPIMVSLLVSLVGCSSSKVGPDHYVEANVVYVILDQDFVCEDMNPDAPLKVTLSDHDGNETDLTIQGDTCYVIPWSVRNPEFELRPIKMYGNSSSCLELHYAPDCSRKYDQQFRPAYPGNPNQQNLVINIGADLIGSNKAMSRCGAFCNKIPPEINPGLTEENPGEDVVTLYEHLGYYGHHIHVNLSAGCVTLGDKLEVLAVIRTYGKCVILYSVPNCVKDKSGTYSYQTSGKSLEYYVEKATALTTPIYVKSLQFCPENSSELPAEQGNATKTEDCKHLSLALSWLQIYVGVCSAILSAVGSSYLTKLVVKKRNKIGRNTEQVSVHYETKNE